MIAVMLMTKTVSFRSAMTKRANENESATLREREKSGN